MKRFYKEVTISGAAPFQILLDGRTVKTPLRAALTLPTQALAEAVAAEWRGQGEEVVPHAMPLTKLANTAHDRVAALRDEVVSQILAYSNDTLCYRVPSPAELVERQHAEWDPLLEWAAGRYGVRLRTSVGIAHIAQPEEALAMLRDAVAAHGLFGLAGLHTAASLLTSLVLTLALAEERLNAEEAFALSRLEERYQIELWGEDEEATIRAQGQLAELKTVERFLRLSR